MASLAEPVRAELVQLLVLLALVAGFYFLVIPAGIVDPDGFHLDEGLPPSFSARLAAGLAALIIVLRLGRLLAARVAPDRFSLATAADPNDPAVADSTSTRLNARTWVGVVLALVFSLVLIPVLGFFLASIGLLVALLWLLGERNWVSLSLYPLLVTLGVWLLFGYLLSVRLPDGWLISWLGGGS